jgi:hypothetical protein
MNDPERIAEGSRWSSEANTTGQPWDNDTVDPEGVKERSATKICDTLRGRPCDRVWRTGGVRYARPPATVCHPFGMELCASSNRRNPNLLTAQR